MKKTRALIAERYDVLLALACGPTMALAAGFLARLLDPGSF